MHVFAARIASISFNAPPFVHLISFCCKLSFLVMKIDKENVFVSLHEIADFSTLYMQSVIYLKKNTSVNVCLLEQMYSKRVLLEPLLSNERNARCCRRTLHRTLQDVCTLTTFSMSIYACIMYWTFSLHSSLQSQSIDYPSLWFSIALKIQRHLKQTQIACSQHQEASWAWCRSPLIATLKIFLNVS